MNCLLFEIILLLYETYFLIYFLRFWTFESFSRSLRPLSSESSSSSRSTSCRRCVRGSWTCTQATSTNRLERFLICFIQNHKIMLELTIERSTSPSICSLRVLNAPKPWHRVNESKQFEWSGVCRWCSGIPKMHRRSRQKSGDEG